MAKERQEKRPRRRRGGLIDVVNALLTILVFGILVAFGALFLRLNSIVFGEPVGPTAPAEASYVPMFVHLAIVAMAGVYLPPALVTGFQNVARLLG